MSNIKFTVSNDRCRDEGVSTGSNGSTHTSAHVPDSYNNSSSGGTPRDLSNYTRYDYRSQQPRRAPDSPGHESQIRNDYREKFGSATREREKVEEYRRWEMGQLLYGPTGQPPRHRTKPVIVTTDHFELIMKEMSELYDVDYDSIGETVGEAKRVASVHAKGCFICRLCRHTWASEMSWVDIDLRDRCICCYYQQKCMHCCEETDSAAIPMFTDTQLRRLVCRSFLRAGLVRSATLSLKVFLAGPARPKTAGAASRPHLGLLCGKCGYDSTDLPPCSAAQASKERADKKLSTLYDDMRDKVTADTKPGLSGETITVANGNDGGGHVCHGHGPSGTLRRPKFESASHKRPHFATFSSAAKKDGKVGQPRLPVHSRLGPVNKVEPAGNKVEPAGEQDFPAAKRPRKPITFDNLSARPDNDDYVGVAPDKRTPTDSSSNTINIDNNSNGATGKRGRRQKSMLLSHLERAKAAKTRRRYGNDSVSDSGSLDDDDDDVEPALIKKEKPWQQFGNLSPSAAGAAAAAETRTEEQWQEMCFMRVEDADGDVEYMYSVSADGDLFNNTEQQQQQASVAVADDEEQLVVGPDGQPMRVKSEKEDPAYFAHLNGRKPVHVKEELPWMQDGANPYGDEMPELMVEGDDEDAGGMLLVEDADGEVEYLYTTYREPVELTLDEEEEEAARMNGESATPSATTPIPRPAAAGSVSTAGEASSASASSTAENGSREQPSVSEQPMDVCL